MTDKRFKWEVACRYDESLLRDAENGQIIAIDDCLELLNELHEENMMLKGEVAHYQLILMSLEEEAKRISQIR